MESFNFEKVPEGESKHASRIEDALNDLDRYIRNFKHALALFDESEAELQTLDRTGSKGRKLWGWQFMAARDAALTVYHFRTTLHSAIAYVSKAPKLAKLIDTAGLTAAKNLFEERFPTIKGLRHAIAHEADNVFSEEALKSNAIGGNLMLGGNFHGDVFKYSNKGVEVSIAFNDPTLRELIYIKREVSKAFVAIAVPLPFWETGPR